MKMYNIELHHLMIKWGINYGYMCIRIKRQDMNNLRRPFFCLEVATATILVG